MTYDIANLPGQINLQSDLGKIIYGLVKYHEFENIVDVGTWNGMGTTTCILQALEDSQKTDTNIYSIELYPEMLKIAKDNLSDYLHKYNLKLLQGRISDPDEVYGWFDHSSIDFENDMHAKLWYDKDMELLKQSQSILNLLPQNIDLLILDGGEYSTYPEWQKLKSRIKYFVLDDTNILKCSQIKREVISDTEQYTVLYDVSSDRNGYLVGLRNV
jgi:hypothetical protein